MNIIYENLLLYCVVILNLCETPTSKMHKICVTASKPNPVYNATFFFYSSTPSLPHGTYYFVKTIKVLCGV